MLSTWRSTHPPEKGSQESYQLVGKPHPSSLRLGPWEGGEGGSVYTPVGAPHTLHSPRRELLDQELPAGEGEHS